MSLLGIRKTPYAIPPATPSSINPRDLKALFQQFKHIKADKSLPEHLRSQQLRQHAALIYSELHNKSATRVRP